MLDRYGVGLFWMQGYMANNGDLNAHEQTYTGFTALLKWGTIASAVTALIVVLLIAN